MKKIVVFAVLCVSIFAQTSLEIAKKSYEVMSGYKESVSVNTMILKNAQGVENIRKLKIKKLESIDGDKSLIEFLYPLDIKDTKLLSYEQIGGDDKQWLYLPALKRVKRISSSNKSGSFMASEFSYEDISSQNYKNFTYMQEVKKALKDNVECFVITRVPIDENSGYTKQIIYIDTNTYLAKFGEYFDKQDRLLKEVSFLEYIKLDNIYRIKKMQMFNVQTKKSSVLIWDEDRIKAGLDEKDFSKRALE
ncbi:outer membrane lipoprotein-sorting protein [bacterium]|nr:outer membrane lipoprotein-sorting protein [bacterium]MBU1883073.1 outer membrane lipoprotein-sorting protein [bacterium]